MTEQVSEIAFACPHCGLHMQASSDMAGKEISCPGCRKQTHIPILIPPSLPIQNRAPSRTGRVVAGLVGGLILASLGTNTCSVFYIDPTTAKLSGIATVFSALIFLGLWTGSVVFALRTESTVKAWRRLLISNACLCFALPLAGIVMSIRAAYLLETKGRSFEAVVMASAGGVTVIFLAILGFFLGGIFLLIGFLGCRDKPRTG